MAVSQHEWRKSALHTCSVSAWLLHKQNGEERSQFYMFRTCTSLGDPGGLSTAGRSESVIKGKKISDSRSHQGVWCTNICTPD